MEVNAADYHMLLRVPGIGVKSAMRILAARKTKKLELSDLKTLGVVLKRAVYFLSCKGRYMGNIPLGSPLVRYALSEPRERQMELPQQFDVPSVPLLARASEG